MSPRMAALSEPWPAPVDPSEPNSSTSTRAVDSTAPRSSRAPAKRWAARIGPTVWDELGPMPIEKRSKTLTVTTHLRNAAIASRHAPSQPKIGKGRRSAPPPNSPHDGWLRLLLHSMERPSTASIAKNWSDNLASLISRRRPSAGGHVSCAARRVSPPVPKAPGRRRRESRPGSSGNRVGRRGARPGRAWRLRG